MSRIGKAPIALPKGVEVKVDDKTNTVTVKGPKGTLQQTVNPDLHVAVEDGHTAPSTVSIAHSSTTWLSVCRKAIARKWN